MLIVSYPVKIGNSIREWGLDAFTVYSENRSLRAENENLRNWRQVAVNLELENERLKDLLNSDLGYIDTLVTARVVGVSGGPYIKSILLNMGRKNGVKVGSPVVNQNGVVGRAIMVGPRSSRVLLISDLNSRIPVKIKRTNQNGIVIGRNGSMLDLMFLPVDQDIVVGDVVLTSGDGDAFPPDLMLGEVVLIGGDNIQVLPSATLNELNFVRVLDFDKNTFENEASVAVETQSEEEK